MSLAVSDPSITDWSGPASTARHKINGVTLHDVEVGAPGAPLVILLHGFPDFWWGWRRQIGHLAASGFRVVVPDQRGYNLSEKPIGFKAYDLDTLAADIIGLADAYGCEKVQLVGHDFGGFVGWWTATRHPDRVERLVAINAPHPHIALSYVRRHPIQMMRSFYMGIFQLPWVPESILGLRDYAVLRKTLTMSSRAGTFSAADMKRYENAWAMPGALTGMVNWYRALRIRPNLTDATVKVPTLVMWGLRDHFLDRGLADESLKLCENGQFLGFENATHWVHLEEAEGVNEALVSFLKS
ncbi:alpha/beta fold hydrolase [Microvirga alba]|uniref:Alpha/beta hydrolase n=1 Tax=Microvirga alba TaxID=2791025 RepID=A0A931BNL5_9HYPH|nr:alpha/beta hydrolase [Microvirga alba]MBF9232794.1 alpha/beta hydrolase [Microvirga alba]